MAPGLVLPETHPVRVQTVHVDHLLLLYTCHFLALAPHPPPIEFGPRNLPPIPKENPIIQPRPLFSEPNFVRARPPSLGGGRRARTKSKGRSRASVATRSRPCGGPPTTTHSAPPRHAAPPIAPRKTSTRVMARFTRISRIAGRRVAVRTPCRAGVPHRPDC